MEASISQCADTSLRQVDLSRNSFSIYGFLSITKFCRAQSQLRILKLFKCELWLFEEQGWFFKVNLTFGSQPLFIYVYLSYLVFFGSCKKVYDGGSLCGWVKKYKMLVQRTFINLNYSSITRQQLFTQNYNRLPYITSFIP